LVSSPLFTVVREIPNLELLNQAADDINAEATDVLDFQTSGKS
jgi:hypothetical protein